MLAWFIIVLLSSEAEPCEKSPWPIELPSRQGALADSFSRAKRCPATALEPRECNTLCSLP